MNEKVPVIKHWYDGERHTRDRNTKVIYDQVDDQPVMDVPPQHFISDDRRQRKKIHDQRNEEDDDHGDSLDDGDGRCRLVVDPKTAITVVRSGRGEYVGRIVEIIDHWTDHGDGDANNKIESI